MKLDCESTLSLNDLKGAYVYKTIKEGKEEKEVQYRIYDFSIEFAPCFDNPERVIVTGKRWIRSLIS